MRKLCRIICFFSLILFLIFFDQVLKFLVINFNFLPVSYNQGISFGWLPNNGWFIVNLIIIIVVVFIILIKGTELGGLLILSGGLSNFIDRLWRGGVVDWIRIPLFFWSFNLADVMITMGVILLILNQNESKNRL